MNSTPVSLLDRLRDTTEPAAWERFVQLYSPLLCQWARRLGLHGPDEADLVQDVFALLVVKLPHFRYDPRKRFRGWLWTVTANKARERRRKPAVPLAPNGNQLLEDIPDPEPLEAITAREYREYLVQRALHLMQKDFHPTTWKVFWECVTQERAPAEVAADLNLTVAAVYAAKSRVLRHLRRELDGLLE